jgi:hypothetical protein
MNSTLVRVMGVPSLGLQGEGLPIFAGKEVRVHPCSNLLAQSWLTKGSLKWTWFKYIVLLLW